MKAPTFRVPRAAFTLIELLTVIAIIGILAAIIIPVIGKVRSSARNTQCASNLRQLALANQLYASDNKDLMAAGWNSGAGKWWGDYLGPYIGRGSGSNDNAYTNGANTITNCPSRVADITENKATYGWNAFMDDKNWGRRMSAPPNPSLIIMIGDMTEVNDSYIRPTSSSTSGGANFERHGGTANFAYMDGSVRARRANELITATENHWKWW